MGDQSHELGMKSPITRRDFLDGVATAAVAGACAQGGSSYPRARTGEAEAGGFRGDTPDVLGVPHALRDGRFWEHAGVPDPTGEAYDLVVAGAGISGMTAAYRWLRQDPAARVLVLDNRSELGGGPEAQYRAPGGPRRPSGRPAMCRPEGRDLLDDLGVRPAEYDAREVGPGLGMYEAVYCDRETFPAERLVVHSPGRTTEDIVAELPINDTAKQDLIRLYEDPPDWFPGLTDEEKKERLAGLTYSAFLEEVCGAHPDVVKFCRTMPSAEWGYGSDAFGAIDAWAGRGRYPGFGGLGLDASKPSRYNSPTVAKRWSGHAYRFPEAMVSTMVARMIPGFTAARLDRPGNRLRIRLASPVVMAANDADGGATVGYFDGHRVRTVRAGSVILACRHTMIPYLVPELPPEQRSALGQAVRTPLITATVRLRDWSAWQRAGVGRVRFTGAYWVSAELDLPGGAGGEPILANLVRVPAVPGMPPAQGAVAGRRELVATPYEYLEFTLREQLTRLLGPAGFDPGRDIEAVTVNRWGHAGAREYARPWDAFHPDGPLPAEIASRRLGRIAIAGSDAVPEAGADAAVASAYRAVADLMA
ncbi:spermidine dehydrogenase SpdH [Microtetraspora sp. NBRC 13810]|uniref:FAD-dependent oxidoreductase n=1 Tax=Microtetraspora sp. NBRC 13810 TaxID=3030990 RepID=UPI0024A15E03|nr:FAD/NAD(P)-binding protein [Microtetraspora sp. NBRC 13810]GLW09989.1 spermidine dehydrogenase SpdH [Microtetraspora sp. NBRC 13810]